jgi:hypothetical protein
MSAFDVPVYRYPEGKLEAWEAVKPTHSVRVTGPDSNA